MKKQTSSYIKPLGTWIGYDAHTHHLYTLEAACHPPIEAAAKELAVVLGHDPAEYWTCSLPEALLSILNSYDREAAKLAAQSYLELMHGAFVTFVED